jgi:hypothetical protein
MWPSIPELTRLRSPALTAPSLQVDHSGFTDKNTPEQQSHNLMTVSASGLYGEACHKTV